MKKLLLVFMAMVFSTGMFAQDAKMKNHVMMKDNKMWVMMDGKTMAMDKDMTMSNGTMVSTTGKVTMKDGKTMMMKNGDMMDTDGMMGKHDMKKDKSKMK